MKARPCKYDSENYRYVTCDKSEATHVHLLTRGHFKDRYIPVQPNSNSGWAWNGDTDRPTLSPSIRTSCTGPEINMICHSFVRDGQIEYLTDSTHEFAGHTLPLIDHEES